MQTSTTIPAASEGIAMARDVVSRLLGEANATDRIEDAKLLTSEVGTNAVRHAGSNPVSTIGLAVETSPHLLRVEVSDLGPGFNVGAIKPPPGQNVSGWGLFLVERVSDGWGVIRNSPNIVWFELKL